MRVGKPLLPCKRTRHRPCGLRPPGSCSCFRCRENSLDGRRLPLSESEALPARHPSAINKPEERKMNPYSSLCDDFGVYVYLTTKMDLPSGRETVLHYFDGIRKTF